MPDLETPGSDPTDLAVWPRDTIFNFDTSRFFHERSEDLQHTFAVLWQYKVAPLLRLCIEAFDRTAPDPLKGRTDVLDLAHVRRTDPECIRDVVRQHLEFLIALAQGIFRLLTFRDDG